MTDQELVRNLNILEGRFTVDDGGPTECGITQNAWDPYCRLRGKPPSSVSTITAQDELEFYQYSYIYPLMIDKLAGPVQFVLFQWAINHEGSGDSGGSVMSLQHCVSVTPDGIMGQETVDAANKCDPYILADCILARQETWYKEAYAKNNSLPLDGWENRITKTRKIVGLPVKEA